MNRIATIFIRVFYLSWLGYFFYQSINIWPQYSFHPLPSLTLLTMMTGFVIAVEWEALESIYRTIKKWIKKQDS
jgi:hypothetical protein